MRSSIIFAVLGIIFLATACDATFRTRPVRVEERVEVRHDNDHHDYDHNDHHYDHR